MELRKLIVILFPFLLFAGVEKIFFPYYFALYPYGSLLYPDTGETEIYLDGFRLPFPVFDEYPEVPPSKLGFEGSRDSIFLKGKNINREILGGPRGDFALRYPISSSLIQAYTFQGRKGREWSMLGLKEGKNYLFYLNLKRNYSLSRGEWRDVGFSSLEIRGKNYSFASFISGFSSTNEMEKFSLLSFNLIGSYSKPLSNSIHILFLGRFEAAHGKYSWKGDKEIFLNDSPLMRISYSGFSYTPKKLDTGIFIIKKIGLLKGKAGISAMYLGGKFFFQPFLSSVLGSGRNKLFISYSGIPPKIENLKGISRREEGKLYYWWDGSEWKEIGRETPPKWEDAPNFFKRLTTGGKFSKKWGSFEAQAGVLYIRDWDIGEDYGIWGKEEETRVFFKGQKFKVWREEDIKGYRYDNFNNLWREKLGGYLGFSLKLKKLNLSSYISLKTSKGNYPFSPFCYYPGEYCLYSSAIMNDRNRSPENEKYLEGNLPWGNGISSLFLGEYTGKKLEALTYFYLFRNPPINSFILVSGLPQGNFYLPTEKLGKKEGMWNFAFGGYLKLKFRKFSFVFEGENFFLKSHILKTNVNGKEKALLLFPPQRILIGISF